MPFDKILIEDLEVECILGIYPRERETPQKILIHLEIFVSPFSEDQPDQIDSVLNYEKVVERVRAYIQSSQFQLVESLANSVAKLLFEEFKIPKLNLKICKLGILPAVKKIGLEISRENPAFK